MTTLETYGWNERLANNWRSISDAMPHLTPARVVADFGTSLRLATPELITAELSGKLAHYADQTEVPKVGDWVGVHITDNTAVIEIVIPRSGEIARSAAGNKTVKQVIAAGIDTAFVILALDNDFSVDRLRRFLYQLSIHSITPIIVLNKADKTDDVSVFKDQLAQFSLPIIIASAKNNQGIEDILAFISPTKTAILLGSSGVGKSTITNLLLGEVKQATQETRISDDSGKHTTVHRELFLLPTGGMLIDTPGIRELQLWGTEEDLEENYDDIAHLISQCRYSSCQHGTEDGCAIQHALKEGTLAFKHYAAYRKLKTELVRLSGRRTAKSKADSQTAKKRSLTKQHRKLLKEERDDAI